MKLNAVNEKTDDCMRDWCRGCALDGLYFEGVEVI